MASVKGTNVTNIDASPIVKVDSSEWHGNLRVQHDSYEASSLASGSDITVARLPKGAKVYDIIVHFDALGGSSTVSVGDSADADRYIAATSTASAGQMSMSQEGAIAGFGYENTAETDVILTTGGASITGTIKTAVIYSVE
jgi:hypothetical protein